MLGAQYVAICFWTCAIPPLGCSGCVWLRHALALPCVRAWAILLT